MDKLTDHFGEKFKNRINFEKILKLQRKAKEFINHLRDKRMKFNLKMEKLLTKIKRDTFNDLIDYSQKNNNRLKFFENFLTKLKRLMRIRIFHALLFRIFEIPVEKMRKQIRDGIMKNHFIKFHMFFLRNAFHLWNKNARPSQLTPAQLANMAKILRNKIQQPSFNDLIRRLKRLPKKGLREKVMKKLTNRLSKIDKEMTLREYFTRWRDIARNLVTQEFKTTIFDTFLFRTSKGILQKKLARNFRLWHLKSIKKIDLEKVNEFIENVKKPLRRHVYNACFPKIENCIEGIKLKTSKALFGFKGKFKFLTLRKYWTKWNDVNVYHSKQQLQTKLFMNLKTKNQKLGVYKILAGRFQDWRRKTNILIYLNRQTKMDFKKRKELGCKNLNDALTFYAKKKCFPYVTQPVKKYLIDIIKSKAIKQMAKNFPKLDRILKKGHLQLWRNTTSYLRKKEFRNKLFDKVLNNSASKIQKNFLRIFFQKWNRNKAKNPLALISEGCRHLKNHVISKALPPVIDAFNQKMNHDNMQKRIFRNGRAAKISLKMKNKFLFGLYRNGLQLWKVKTLKVKTREDRQNVWAKLLNSNLNKIMLKSLANRFGFWRSNKKEFKWAELKCKRQEIQDAVEKIVKKNHKLNDPVFWKNLNKHKSNPFLKRFNDKLVSFTDLADNIKKKKVLYLWNNKCKKLAILDLKKKFIGNVFQNKHVDIKKLWLLGCLRNWLKQVNLMRLLDETNIKIQISNGVDHLKKLMLMRNNFFINRMKKFIRKDVRGKIILSIERRLKRPRMGMDKAFDFWKRKAEILKFKENESRLIERILFASCKKLRSRFNRDSLKKRLLRWKKCLDRPEDYYDKICRGVKTLDHFLLKKNGDTPFTLIANHKDYTRVFDKLLPAGSKLKKRLLRDSLIKNWKRWKQIIIDARNRDLGCKIVRNFKNNQLKTFKANIMSKYFRKFAGYRPKSLKYPDVVKGELRIKRTILNRDWFAIKTRMKKFGDMKAQKQATDLLFGKSKVFMKKKLHRSFLLWHKNMLRDDSNIKNKVLKNFKRIVIDTYFSSPLQAGFRRWLRKMIIKPVDIKTTVNGLEKLYMLFRRRFNPIVFKKVLGYRSGAQLQKALINKCLPNSKFAIKRLLRGRLLLWNDKVRKIDVRDMKAKTLKWN